jgi:hypothetical protein
VHSVPALSWEEALLEQLEQLGAQVESFGVSDEGGLRRIVLDADVPRGAHPTDFVRQLATLSRVRAVRWESGSS